MNMAALSALVSNDIENFLVAATPGGIEAQEKRGQQALVKMDALPKDAPWEQLEQLGIKRGAEIDDLFVSCTLPDGWRKVATDHSMHSNLIDDKGRKRGGIFYKAAFYDRSANMHLTRRYSYGVEPVGGWNVADTSSCHWHCVVTDDDKVLWSSEQIEPRPQDNYQVLKWYERRDALNELGKAWIAEHYPDYANPLAYWD